MSTIAISENSFLCNYANNVSIRILVGFIDTDDTFFAFCLIWDRLMPPAVINPHGRRSIKGISLNHLHSEYSLDVVVSTNGLFSLLNSHFS